MKIECAGKAVLSQYILLKSGPSIPMFIRSGFASCIDYTNELFSFCKPLTNTSFTSSLLSATSTISIVNSLFIPNPSNSVGTYPDLSHMKRCRPSDRASFTNDWRSSKRLTVQFSSLVDDGCYCAAVVDFLLGILFII